MDLLTLLPLLLFGVYLLNRRDQRDRIALLGSYLSRYRVEKLMENLMQGYMRALGESDPDRQASIWRMLANVEIELAEQFSAFALDFAKVDETQARVSRLALALPYASRWLPGQTFDLRQALGLHAHALAQAASADPGADPKRKAFTMMAELMLMQHTCHWFCRSRTMASTRLLARHQTTYEQVLAAVAPDTRQAYLTLIRA